jgi:hypothetical protein
VNLLIWLFDIRKNFELSLIRFRPVNEREKSEKVGRINASLSFDDLQVHIVSEDTKEKQSYSFDRVFWNTKTTQVNNIIL